ncbi:MAG: hypothetical protein Q9226_002590 [Calogaya cf. arnoldii]
MVTANFLDLDDEELTCDVDNEKEWYNFWEDLDYTCDPCFIVQSSNFAHELEGAGEWKKGATIYQRLLPTIRTEHSEEDVCCMRFQYDVARFRVRDGRYEDAEALAQPLLAIRERILGASHQHTLNVRELLSDCYAETGRLEEAENMLLTMQSGALLCSVGSKYAKRGALETAYEKLSGYIAQLRTLIDRDNNNLLITLTYLADVCMKLGKDDEAENILQDILNKRIGSWGGWGTERSETVAAMEQIGSFYEEQNRHEDALSMWKKVKNAWAQELGVDHQRTIGAHFHLALSKRTCSLPATTMTTFSGKHGFCPSKGILPDATSAQNGVRKATVSSKTFYRI